MVGIITRPRILLVGGDQKILRFTRLKLMVSCYEVITAMTGQGTLTMTESQNPDILVLDLKMPSMGGLEVLKVLRGFSKIPIIVVSGADELAEQAMGLGANAYVAKPFHPDELSKMIRDILDRKVDAVSFRTSD